MMYSIGGLHRPTRLKQGKDCMYFIRCLPDYWYHSVESPMWQVAYRQMKLMQSELSHASRDVMVVLD